MGQKYQHTIYHELYPPVNYGLDFVENKVMDVNYFQEICWIPSWCYSH